MVTEKRRTIMFRFLIWRVRCNTSLQMECLFATSIAKQSIIMWNVSDVWFLSMRHSSISLTLSQLDTGIGYTAFSAGMVRKPRSFKSTILRYDWTFQLCDARPSVCYAQAHSCIGTRTISVLLGTIQFSSCTTYSHVHGSRSLRLFDALGHARLSST